jgi:hypothetical protein
MRVRVVANSGKSLSRESLKIHFITEDYQDILRIGDVYTVYGISMWEGAIHYLTAGKFSDDPSYDPTWCPAELFEIADNRLPPEWYFRFYGYGPDAQGINAVWGYKELALSLEHYQQLVLREGLSHMIFTKRRKEIDQFHLTK